MTLFCGGFIPQIEEIDNFRRALITLFAQIGQKEIPHLWKGNSITFLEIITCFLLYMTVTFLAIFV